MLNKKINFKNANQVHYLHVISLKKKKVVVSFSVSAFYQQVSVPLK